MIFWFGPCEASTSSIDVSQNRATSQLICERACQSACVPACRSAVSHVCRSVCVPVFQRRQRRRTRRSSHRHHRSNRCSRPDVVRRRSILQLWAATCSSSSEDKRCTTLCGSSRLRSFQLKCLTACFAALSELLLPTQEWCTQQSRKPRTAFATSF